MKAKDLRKGSMYSNGTDSFFYWGQVPGVRKGYASSQTLYVFFRGDKMWEFNTKDIEKLTLLRDYDIQDRDYCI